MIRCNKWQNKDTRMIILSRLCQIIGGNFFLFNIQFLFLYTLFFSTPILSWRSKDKYDLDLIFQTVAVLSISTLILSVRCSWVTHTCAFISFYSYMTCVVSSNSIEPDSDYPSNHTSGTACWEIYLKALYCRLWCVLVASHILQKIFVKVMMWWAALAAALPRSHGPLPGALLTGFFVC